MSSQLIRSMVRKAGIRFRSILRRLYDRSPHGKAWIDRLWNTFEILYFNLFVLLNRVKNRSEEAKSVPTELVEFDPKYIKYHSSSGFHSFTDSGAVVNGNWDSNPSTAVKEKTRWKSFKNHFEAGISWENTEFYQQKREKIKSEKTAKYETVDALDRKCAELDQLYKDIQEKGYKTQAELARAGKTGQLGDGGIGLLLNTNKSLVRHEISVDIGRTGEPFLNEGRHRITIAKLHNIDQIPVRVVVRHREWQDLRNDICKAIRSAKNKREAMKRAEARIDEYEHDVLMGIDHPDMQLLFDESVCRAS